MKKIFLLAVAIAGLLSMQWTVHPEPQMSIAELGQRLFFDPILSADRSISCATCHQPEHAFADTQATSIGVHGAKGARNTPSAMNLSLQKTFFWDGRAKSLEEQALMPIVNPDEMNLPLIDAVERLRSSLFYSAAFKSVFQQQPSASLLSKSIAAFEKTLETGESAFDLWKLNDDSTVISAAARRGFDLFNGKGKCVKCHFGADFTQNEFRNIGLFDGMKWNDSGRATISHQVEDMGKFKTSGLRNVAVTAPYMHNGRFKTLKEVIEFYNDPEKIVPAGKNRDTVLAHPLGLTASEMTDLESFLRALTDKRFVSK